MSKSPLDLDHRSLAFINSLADVKQKFWEDGYIILRNVFSQRETSILKKTVVNCAEMDNLYKAVKQKQEDGKYPSFESIFVMNDVFGEDVFSKATRNYKLLDTVSYLFDDDAYVYHNKVTLKYKGMVGFKYHQDYFYWYQMGCLFPNMATCFIALEHSTKENGCLKVIPGSHKLGRVEHTLFDGFSDSEVESERLEAVKSRFVEVYAELEAGDVIMFHCNLFHGSNQNLSNTSRLSLLGCYNTAKNSPINSNWSHPQYSVQERVFNEIVESDAQLLPDFKVTFEK